MNKFISFFSWSWFSAAAIFSFLCVISTQLSGLSLILFAAEYAILIFYLVKNPVKAFVYYTIFTTTALEFDAFIYFQGISTISRYTFFTSSSLYLIISIILIFRLSSSYPKKNLLNTQQKRLLRWLVLLGVTGVVSFIIVYVSNDNNMRVMSVYPEEFFYQVRSYVTMCIIILGTFIMMKYSTFHFEDIIYSVFVGIVFSTVVSILLGYRGFYGVERIMMAPLASCFAPCLLMFVKKDGFLKNPVLWLTIIILFLGVCTPNMMGSKWYLIIFVVLIYLVWHILKTRSTILIILLGLIGLYFVPILGVLLESSATNDSMSAFKLLQAIHMLNFFDSGSFFDWFNSLDRSAQFRIDEPWNILIEYINKPQYILFGKGFGGTITQHTDFLNWSGPGAFSDMQTRFGIYYNMHESIANVLLRHGLLGIMFLLYSFLMLFEKIKETPWAIIGILWLFFFWTYGLSLRLGAIAVAIAISINLNSKRDGIN